MPNIPKKIFSLMLCGTLLLVISSCDKRKPQASHPSTIKDSNGHIIKLPDNFYWGVATAGYQVEGYSKPTNWEVLAAAKHGVPVGNADDFFHRYAADIDRAKGLGVNVFRLSVEWSRLEPSPGLWDPQGFAFYDKVINKIVADGMRPMITLDHWTYPRWAYEAGGWKKNTIISQWLNFGHKVVDRYAHAQPLWVTFNEPEIKLMLEAAGDVDGAAANAVMSGSASKIAAVVLDNLITAHNSIYSYIHKVQPHAQVTCNTYYLAGFENIFDLIFYNKIIDSLDFVSFDYYYGQGDMTTGFNKPWLNQLQTEGIYYVLRYFHRKYPGKPIYVTENGMPTDNGKPRADGYTRSEQLLESIYWLQRAFSDGVNVIGYNYWSLLDNYEWGSYNPRFGLYTVNVVTDRSLRRIPTAAVTTFMQIIKDHGVPDGYLPTHNPVQCSQVDYPSSCTEPVKIPR